MHVVLTVWWALVGIACTLHRLVFKIRHGQQVAARYTRKDNRS